VKQNHRGAARTALLWLTLGSLLSTATVALLVAAWLGYTHHSRERRETKTPEQLDGGKGRWINAADARVHVREWGPDAGPTVLLTHGTGGWSGAWFSLPDALSNAGWHVVAMDLPPFGLSTTPLATPAVQYTRQAQARRILAVIDSLGAPVTLVAHSFGSGPSLEAAMHSEGRLRQLVLIDPALGLGPNGEPPVCEASGLVSSLLANRDIRSAILASTVTWPGLTAPLLRSFVFKKDMITEELVAAYQIPFERVGFTPLLGDYVASFTRSNCERADSLEFSKLSDWSRSGPPIALIWGQEDRITPVAQAIALQRHLQGATLNVLPGVGHIPQVESPTELAATLLSALRQQR
jgi:pimeloyl-ACP methyl ester carboxylesterase